MRIPHFLRLVEVDRLHFITACRTGLVHLTWGRATLRFDREEFRQLAWLLERIADIPPPTMLSEGDLLVTRRPGEESEVRVGPVALLLPPAEFGRFGRAVCEAVAQLDEILESGVWDAPVEDEEPPATLDPTGRTPFSPN